MKEDKNTFDGMTKEDIERLDKIIKSMEPDNYDWMDDPTIDRFEFEDGDVYEISGKVSRKKKRKEAEALHRIKKEVEKMGIQ